MIKSALAAELLGKGFAIWKKHITVFKWFGSPDFPLGAHVCVLQDLHGLLLRLLTLFLSAKEELSAPCSRALMQAGHVSPKQFVTTMGKTVSAHEIWRKVNRHLILSLPLLVTVLGCRLEELAAHSPRRARLHQ